MLKSRKLTLFGILVMSVFLINGLASGRPGLFDDDKIISKDNITSVQRTTLESKGIDTWGYEDRVDDTHTTRKLISNNSFNLPDIRIKQEFLFCVTPNNLTSQDPASLGELVFPGLCDVEELRNHTTQEMEDLLDAEMIKVMSNIADVIKVREERNSPILINDGVVSIEN